MRTSICIPVLLILGFFSCREEAGISAEISAIPMDLEVRRFDQEFANAKAAELPGLKNKYPYLFPEQFPDSVWLAKLNDSLQIQLSDEVNKTFGDFGQEEADLELLLKHIKYYYPEISRPKVITVISDVDYNNRVILADTLLLIGLDNYLGAEHPFYGGIDRYIANELDKKYLTSDVAAVYANRLAGRPSGRTFLDRMVFYGKLLYLKDKWMPRASDAEKIHYTEEEYNWALANEEQIWRYFVERELLYSTDQELNPRFLDPAPFSKFRLELDRESPGRLGRFIGWQIVRSFMDNNDLTPKELMRLPEEQIFKNSKYKPNK